MSIAVLDIGKTNVKLAVVASDGEVLHQYSRANRPLAGPPFPHHDVDGIWTWFLATLAECASDDIDAIVTTTHGATAVVMAGDELALPVLDYEYEGVEDISAEYDRVRPSFGETASPGLPVGLNVGRQLYWLERCFPVEFASVTDILPYPQYWAYRLCGRKASEVTSLGCHTDLWNPAERCFSSLARDRGWAELLAPLHRADEVLGNLDPDIARATGLNPRTRVHCGIHDSNASYFCHRADRQPPFTVVSSGTWTICMAAGGDPARLVGEADMLANVDVYGEAVPCARFMGGREFSLISGCDADAPTVDTASIERIVERGVLALPSFAPQGGPFRDHEGRATPAMPAVAADRAALATLYCALVTDHCLTALGSEGELIIEGSLARNEAFLGVLAALRGKQAVTASLDATGTTLGAARLAGLAAARQAGPTGNRRTALALEGLERYGALWRERVECGAA